MKKIFTLICILSLLLTAAIPALAADGSQNNSASGNSVKAGNSDGLNTDRLIVKFEDGASADYKNKVHDSCSADVVAQMDNGTYIVKPRNGKALDQVINEYKKNARIKYVEPDYIVQGFATPNDTYYKRYQQSIFAPMNIISGWDISQGSNSVIIAVVDSGVNFSHPDLTGKLLSNGYDFVNKDNDPTDDCGHGTLTAGVIGATMNNSLGIAGASASSILPVKVLNRTGGGYESDVALGIIYAANQGADVISLSLGTSSPCQAMQDAVNYANSLGVIVIAAAGNSNSSVMYPAACDNVVSVGAITSSSVRASYSCYGASLDLVAVGTGVYSTNMNNAYSMASGTSLACPFVSALAGIIKSMSPNSSPAEITLIMEKSATDLGTTGFDNYYGYGCINYAAALSLVSPGLPVSNPTPTTPVNANTKPVISLNGKNLIRIVLNSSYTELGATVYDVEDGNITENLEISGTVDTAKAGTYIITYNATDSMGAAADTVTLTVIVKSSSKP